MRLAAIIFTLTLVTYAAYAQGTSRREDPLQRLQAAKQLEMIEAALKRRPDSATERNTTLAQIREDFWRIQLAKNDLNASLSNQTAIDSRLIAKTAAEIRTRAKRLKENLALPRAEKDSRPRTVPRASELHASISSLSQLIDSFVNNPMLSQRHVVDLTLSQKASRDLEDIIALSGEIKKLAARRE